ncbi:hypothetical protein BKA82DRAFT_36372 [Pisolithus tinctorius]|nr:hypothetical protein BKA82DRAFT_36372 [Pisolithus tinctorius]
MHAGNNPFNSRVQSDRVSYSYVWVPLQPFKHHRIAYPNRQMNVTPSPFLCQFHIPVPGDLGVGLWSPGRASSRNYFIEKVGILGAGVGGLYTALIPDSLDVEYEILEASDRIGGRLSTYKFPGGKIYDYYDAGAMRFPLPKNDAQGQYKNGIMKRLAELIVYPPLNQGLDRLEDRLIPYYYKAREGPDFKPGFYYFNGNRERISDTLECFRAEQLGMAASYIKAGMDAIHIDVIEPFARMLIADINREKRRHWFNKDLEQMPCEKHRFKFRMIQTE